MNSNIRESKGGVLEKKLAGGSAVFVKKGSCATNQKNVGMGWWQAYFLFMALACLGGGISLFVSPARTWAGIVFYMADLIGLVALLGFSFGRRLFAAIFWRSAFWSFALVKLVNIAGDLVRIFFVQKLSLGDTAANVLDVGMALPVFIAFYYYAFKRKDIWGEAGKKTEKVVELHEAKRPKGIAVLAWFMLTVGGLSWLSLLDIKTYLETYKFLPPGMSVALYCYGVASVAIGIIASVGILRLKEYMRKTAVIINALNVLIDVPTLFFCLPGLKQKAYQIAETMAKESTNPGFSADVFVKLVFSAGVLTIAGFMIVNLLFIWYFTRPKVKAQFK